MQCLTKCKNYLKIVEVVVANIDTYAEVEAGVSAVDDLEVSELHKVCVLGIPHSDHCERIVLNSPPPLHANG
jgi:hypothetical protein